MVSHALGLKAWRIVVWAEDSLSDNLEFPITSMPTFTDLHVHIFDDLAVCRENPIGRVIIPLQPLLVPTVKKATRLLASRVHGR